MPTKKVKGNGPEISGETGDRESGTILGANQFVEPERRQQPKRNSRTVGGRK